MDPTDRELVAGLKRGEDQAFDRVFEAHRGRIFAFLARLSGRRDLAEDLVQETFLRLVRFAPRLEDDTRISVWLYAVARNLYLSHRRWALVDLDRSLSAGRWSMSEALEASPFDMAAASELSRNLERALVGMPLPYREALVLVVIERMSNEDAARVLAISDEALRQRLSRGRKLLSEALQGAPVSGARKVVRHGV